jgi:hypothetical protein
MVIKTQKLNSKIRRIDNSMYVVSLEETLGIAEELFELFGVST